MSKIFHLSIFGLAILFSYCYSILPSLDFDFSLRNNINDPITPFIDAAPVFLFGNVVHVVLTRFMQYQPTLVELGLARVELFRCFCLPTMIQQSKQNFIWIIQTDPNLDMTVLANMIALLQPYPHFFLLASNDNNHNFRRRVVNQSLVLSGNISLLEQATRLSKDHIFIETRLDADDGLNLGLLNHVEQVSVSRLSDPRRLNESRWLVFCIDRHFEWHNFGDSQDGALIFVAEAICVTPGLSFAMAPQTPRSSLPKGAHNLLVLKVSKCQAPNETACLYRMDQIEPVAALRARTLTSAGMANIGKSIMKHNTTDLFWSAVTLDLGIERRDVVKTKMYLDSRMVDIARENLEGQWCVCVFIE